jgi:ribosomal protein S18 acetylase RimI-like enzyme
MKIRIAEVTDAKGIATVGVRTWQTNYRGIFPDEKLDQLSIEEHTERWKNNLIRNKPTENLEIIVVEDPKNGIVGFASGGKYEATHPIYDSEIGAIYVLKNYQGKGIGTAMVKRMVKFFISKEWKSMIIWVLKDNYQRRFYEKLEGISKETKIYEKWGEKYDLIGYVWEDITKIQ